MGKMASIVRTNGVSVLKTRLIEKYTSRTNTAFRPLPRSPIELYVDEVYVELLLAEKSQVADFYREFDGRRSLFLPLDADDSDSSASDESESEESEDQESGDDAPEGPREQDGPHENAQSVPPGAGESGTL